MADGESQHQSYDRRLLISGHSLEKGQMFVGNCRCRGCSLHVKSKNFGKEVLDCVDFFYTLKKVGIDAPTIIKSEHDMTTTEQVLTALANERATCITVVHGRLRNFIVCGGDRIDIDDASVDETVHTMVSDGLLKRDRGCRGEVYGLTDDGFMRAIDFQEKDDLLVSSQVRRRLEAAEPAKPQGEFSTTILLDSPLLADKTSLEKLASHPYQPLECA